jgi:hypothetical protein
MPNHDHELPPVRLAFVLDNLVVDIINTDQRLAAIFLSNPTVVEITNPENLSSVILHSTYNPETNEFTAPVYNPETNEFTAPI